ncbi:MAG: 4Fe-4S dicluster domain-containing protein [Acidimicrobiia bacterium]|nr:4Fe-4S dicluster domain-containing protein [Acidimicrobiia bacterium]
MSTRAPLADKVFVIDPSRYIGSRRVRPSPVAPRQWLIHLEFVDRGTTTETAPMVCMHCEDPTCAEVCPADAIKQNEDGVVQSLGSTTSCGAPDFIQACPSSSSPKYFALPDQMMKCDMCYDRSSEGLAPMCASVCPSQALWFGTEEEFARDRRGELLYEFRFGEQLVPTKVATVVDESEQGPLDVLSGAAAPRWQDDPFGLEGNG